MTGVALAMIALGHVALVVVAITWYRRGTAAVPVVTLPDLEPPHRRIRALHDVFVPIACGIALSYRGMTDSCARRRRHDGRCMAEDELAAAAEHTTLVPDSEHDDRSVDVAALGRHIDDCPSSLHVDGRLSADEHAWLLRTRLMVDALVSGERFSEWGDTKA